MFAATLEARYPRQAESLPTANAAGLAWLPAEDRILATSVSLSTMARLTGRTYWAVERRRRDLGLSNHHNQLEADDGPLLCPCADVDGQHQDWCPAK